MADDAGTWQPDFEDWDAEDASEVAAWTRWVRDDVRVQALAWLVATIAVLGPENSWLLWPGLWEALLQTTSRGQLLAGWATATFMTLGWATGRVQLVFTFEQRAMTFPPWSVLVFCKFRNPEVQSVVFFEGCDGRSYVRRVCSVKQVPNKGSFVQTTGDLPGAPEDRPLYSADGSAAWLEPQRVRGTMAAGPLPFQALLLSVLACLAVSPTATLAFLSTNQPFLAAWLSITLRFCVTLLLHGLA